MILHNILGICWHVFFCTIWRQTMLHRPSITAFSSTNATTAREDDHWQVSFFPSTVQDCRTVINYHEPCSVSIPMLNSTTLHVSNACVVFMLVSIGGMGWDYNIYIYCLIYPHGYSKPPSLSLAFPALQSPNLAFENPRTYQNIWFASKFPINHIDAPFMFDCQSVYQDIPGYTRHIQTDSKSSMVRLIWLTFIELVIELGYGKILTGKPIKFDGKNNGFLLRFSLKPIQWIRLCPINMIIDYRL